MVLVFRRVFLSVRPAAAEAWRHENVQILKTGSYNQARKRVVCVEGGKKKVLHSILFPGLLEG